MTLLLCELHVCWFFPHEPSNRGLNNYTPFWYRLEKKPCPGLMELGNVEYTPLASKGEQDGQETKDVHARVQFGSM